ncbi:MULTISPECIES: protein kinase [unclassified Streptomyces]|uniref:protein kinase domain-containing protein n=1 Tax=unclassified Streptomyces TaxID=2593676 RepID=UPI00093DAA85|nr:protein kinase [Streptomyces sp. CB02400]OKK07143.1 serine/threonine protein kinase [Streptomyces sp. CB02400]
MTRRQPYTVASVPPGHRVGPWIVEKPLGAGAFGNVYAARHEDPGAEPARAALKFLPTGTRTPRQLRHLRELAEREVSLLRRVRSPRLVRMYDVLTVDDPEHPQLDGATVLVLEEARGSLDGLLTGPEPPGNGPALLAQICEGLQQLHEAGWVHGDLKPGNVLLMADGTVRLGDFNLAAELEGTHAYSPAFATADYTPPELLWSEVSEKGMQIRQTADVWAFGVLAHVVLTGSFPLPGGTPAARRDAAVHYARGDEGLRLSPELTAPWREILEDCLAPTHKERARHDAASLRRRVARAGEARGTGRSAPRRSAPRGRRHALVGAGCAIVLAAAGLGLDGLANGGPGTEAGRSSDASASPSSLSSPASPAGTSLGAAGVGLLPGTTGMGSLVGKGWGRCPSGHVCFFSEEQGQGEMCGWEGDDPDWVSGLNDCPWARKQEPASVFNNGMRDPRGYVHVVYFEERGLRDRAGCVKRGERRDLDPGSPVGSHTWATSCAL